VSEGTPESPGAAEAPVQALEAGILEEAGGPQSASAATAPHETAHAELAPTDAAPRELGPHVREDSARAVSPTLAMGPDPARAVDRRPMDASAAHDAIVELNALLGQGTNYAGKLWFEGRVRIEGQFEGDIRGDVLVIGAGAEVVGSIEVGVCIVTGGKVRANIRARDAIELHAPAQVVGDLHAPNVFIDRGVQFEGNCQMAPLEDADAPPAPSPTDATAATFADDAPGPGDNTPAPETSP
jgi:cytoskeletal protein CcmA (bactofilin family)